jgi:hypothetical protein
MPGLTWHRSNAPNPLGVPQRALPEMLAGSKECGAHLGWTVQSHAAHVAHADLIGEGLP